MALRIRVPAWLEKVPWDLVTYGLLGALMLWWLFLMAPVWGPADAFLVAIGVLALAMSIAIASLIRLMLNLMVKQVELFANLLGRGRGGDAKSWAQGKRVR